MSIFRRIQCLWYRIFWYITNGKYYICDECHKIHPSDGNFTNINLNMGIRVSLVCSEKLRVRVNKLLHDSLRKR